MTGKEAIDTAREQASEQDDLFEYNGYTIRIRPIPAAIIQDVGNRIEDPPIPMWHDPELNRDIGNPNDPAYIQAKEKVEKQRGEAIMDAIVMFGIELPNGVPPTQEWLPLLRFSEKRGQLDLSSYDLNDPLELEFLFKRYKLADMPLITEIQSLSSVTPEDVEKAGKPFRRKTQR